MRILIAVGLLVFTVPVNGMGQTQPPPPPPPQSPIITPERAGMSNVPHAMSAPLHDLNLSRTEIPPILLTAMADPYKPPPSLSCRALVPQVRALTDALGADFDQPDTPQLAPMSKKGGRVGLALLHGAAESLLPYAGFVRTLTGAQKHDEFIVEAITAGSVRRGYLKGLADARGCRPPAAPDHTHHPNFVPPPFHAKSKYPPR